MRFGLIILIWVVIVGGLGAYMQQRGQPDAAGTAIIAFEKAEDTYALTITTTFAVEPDPFAIQVDDKDKPPALTARLGNREILRITDRLEAGTPIELNPIPDLIEGENEIYLEANPPVGGSATSNAVKIQILHQNQPISEKIFWADPGSKIAGTFRFIISESEEKKDSHDH